MWILILILTIIIIVFVLKHFRKNKQAPIILYSGRVGGGKSFNMTNQARRFYRKSVRKWKSINKPNLFNLSWWLDIIPRFKNKRLNNEQYGLDKPLLYSTYPIVVKKDILSEPLTNDIMFLRKTIPLNSIVVVDEFSGWISQFEFNEVYSQTLNDHIQKWRHYHGNLSHLLIADQCTNNIPIQVRYRCNQAFVCMETKHILKFIHITKYKMIDLTDDIKSVEVIDNDNADTEDKTLKTIWFHFKRYYDDRAYSNRYTYVDDNNNNYKYMNSPLKTDEVIAKPMPKEKYPILDIIIKEKKKKQAESVVNEEKEEKS